METGCPFGDARWIWPGHFGWDIQNSFALFRKTFTLPAVPRVARLRITADQSYRLFVNGEFVARGPARGFHGRWPYDEFDIAGHLRVGENLIAVRVHQPGRGTFSYRCADAAGFLMALDAEGMRVVSDASWRAIRQISASRDTVPASLQLFSQEHVDLRLEPGNWWEPGYDDSRWVAPQERIANAAPWFAFEPRGIPMCEEKILPPARLIGVAEGESFPAYQNTRDVVALRRGEDRRHHAPLPGGTAPLRVSPGKTGRFRSYLFDFGRTVVGHLALTVRGALGGEILDTHFFETIRPVTLEPDVAFDTECNIAIGNRLICRPGENTHHFHHHQGFRYFTLVVRDATVGLEVDHQLFWTGYPLPREGSFESSDATLNRIWEISAWTQQCCSLDAYVDTPWREQAQWWGDARVQGWNTFHLNGDTRLFERGIGQIAFQKTDDGLTFGHAPTAAAGCVLPDFTLIWILTLWDHYWQTGTPALFQKYGPDVRLALDYFERHTDPATGLVATDPRYWLFLDWTDLPKESFSSVLNLWLLLALQKSQELLLLTGDTHEAQRLAQWESRLRPALHSLVTPDGLVADGIAPDGRIMPTTSIHAQTLAALTRLEGADTRHALETLILPFLHGKITPPAPPSSYWLTYVFSLLTERGRGAEVVEYIRKCWAPMISHGTTWELFNPEPGVQSFSHAWSAHPLYHLMQTLGGITATAPGWREIRYAPVFHGEHNRTRIPTPHGSIEASWEKCADGTRLRLALPEGITATVALPGIPAGPWSGTNEWTLPAEKLNH